jgi:hypothetical protein
MTKKAGSGSESGSGSISQRYGSVDLDTDPHQNAKCLGSGTLLVMLSNMISHPFVIVSSDGVTGRCYCHWRT